LRRAYRDAAPSGIRAIRTATAGDIVAYALQQLINGLTLGAMYGLIAIGYTMVYGIIGMINFAHGDIFMVSAFIAVTAFTILAAADVTSIPLALTFVLIVSIFFTSAYGWAVERTAYRPLRGSTRLAPLISALAACRSSCRTACSSPRAHA